MISVHNSDPKETKGNNLNIMRDTTTNFFNTLTSKYKELHERSNSDRTQGDGESMELTCKEIIGNRQLKAVVLEFY